MTFDQSRSRRTFLKHLGAFPAASVLAKGKNSEGAKAAFAASASGHVTVFGIENGRWRSIQTVASRRPECLVVHPNQRSLYVLNNVKEHEGLPRGTVEAFAIHPGNSQLTLLNRQALSLSATGPRQLAISRDGRFMAVAVYGGGAVNLLAIEPDGSVGQVRAIFKQTGRGPHPLHQAAAHPHSVVFDCANRLLCSDLGCDRVSLFEVRNGGLAKRAELVLPLGMGPGHLALDPAESILYVASQLNGFIASYEYSSEEGKFGREISRSTLGSNPEPSRSIESMVVHPSGQLIFVSRDGYGLSTWRKNFGSNASNFRESLGRYLRALTVDSEGSSLLAYNRLSSAILRLDIDPKEGTLKGLKQVASAPALLSLAFHY